MPLEEMVDEIAAGTLHVQVARTLPLNEIVAAYRCAEENTRQAGK
jgi:NADPH:quinone reductase-like Zn-dependent oxidoreductase